MTTDITHSRERSVVATQYHVLRPLRIKTRFPQTFGLRERLARREPYCSKDDDPAGQLRARMSPGLSASESFVGVFNRISIKLELTAFDDRVKDDARV